MGMFTTVSADAFKSIGLEAGVLLKNFNPSSPAVAENSIVCATTGGISPSCVPQYTDFGEDIDNCPENTKEFKRLNGYECKIGFTALNITPDVLKMSLGAADIADNAVTPRNELKSADFADLWWVGDRADGGFVAIEIKNALSTGGLSIKTTKNGKAQLTVELTAHYSTTNINEVPMKFYVSAGTAA